MNTSKERRALIAGMIGCFLYVIGDFLFAAIGKSQSADSIGLMVKVAYLDMATWRMVVSIICGVLGTALYYIGFYQMWKLLRQHCTEPKQQKWVKVFRVAYLTGTVCWGYVHAMFMNVALIFKFTFEKYGDIQAAAIANKKKIPPTLVQEMMRQALYHIKWYFAKTDLNTDKGKAENKRSVVKYYKWYTPEKEKQYPTSFKVDFVGQPHEGACYYRITRCPICAYAEKLGVSELMPLFCELDGVMITLQHGVLHRKQTLANGGAYCDYYITGNRE